MAEPHDDAPREPRPAPGAGRHSAYPVGLRLSGRRVVVVGGGQVAQRRLPALIAAGADIVLVSPSATPSVEAMVTAGELRWERRRYAEGDLADTWYALVASSDPAANAAASAEAERTRTWCVRSDDAEAATAWTPATGRDGGITVAVLAGSDARHRDPRRSAAVRDAVIEGLREGTIAPAPARGRQDGGAPAPSPSSVAVPATPTSSRCAAAACSPPPMSSSPTGSARATCWTNSRRTSRS